MPWHAGRCSFAGKVEATFKKWRNLVFPLDTARQSIHPCKRRLCWVNRLVASSRKRRRCRVRTTTRP
jgi:hypothetical protein